MKSAARTAGKPSGPLSPRHTPKTREGIQGNTMTTQNSTTMKDEKVRNASLSMLSRGLATQAEVAELAGVSRQVMNYWAQGINWRKAREAELLRAWRRSQRGA